MIGWLSIAQNTYRISRDAIEDLFKLVDSCKIHETYYNYD
jgi:hypothetical protein